MSQISMDEFKEIFDGHYPGLCRLLAGILGNQATAEDIAQDAFLKLLQNPPHRFSNIAGWLTRVGKNLAFNQLRRDNTRMRRESQLERPKSDEPENTFFKEEEMRLTHKALAEISVRDRTCLLLRSSGYSYAEIAEITGVQESSVGTILARSRERFRKEYLMLSGSDDSVL